MKPGLPMNQKKYKPGYVYSVSGILAVCRTSKSGGYVFVDIQDKVIGVSTVRSPMWPPASKIGIKRQRQFWVRHAILNTPAI